MFGVFWRKVASRPAEQKLNDAKSNITVSSNTELAGAAISSRMHIFLQQNIQEAKGCGFKPVVELVFFFFFDGDQRVYRKLINPIILPLETILRNAFVSVPSLDPFFCQLLFMQPLILFQEMCNISFISQDLGRYDETSSMNSL